MIESKIIQTTSLSKYFLKKTITDTKENFISLKIIHFLNYNVNQLSSLIFLAVRLDIILISNWFKARSNLKNSFHTNYKTFYNFSDIFILSSNT